MTKLSHTSYNQRQRIMDYLTNRTGGATTLDIIEELDVLRPAARIFELKEQGHNIVTHWVTQDTPLGTHRVARYVLIPS